MLFCLRYHHGMQETSQFCVTLAASHKLGIRVVATYLVGGDDSADWWQLQREKARRLFHFGLLASLINDYQQNRPPLLWCEWHIATKANIFVKLTWCEFFLEAVALLNKLLLLVFCKCYFVYAVITGCEKRRSFVRCQQLNVSVQLTLASSSAVPLPTDGNFKRKTRQLIYLKSVFSLV